MYAIEKKFSFSAAHLLTGLCDEHPCMAFHGHNYDVYIRIESETLDDKGFVIDFNDLKKFKKNTIDGLFDHATIVTDSYYNEKSFTDSLLFKKMYVLPKNYTNTTVENMCHHMYKLLVKHFAKIKFTNYTAIRIRMSETDSSFAEYYEPKKFKVTLDD